MIQAAFVLRMQGHEREARELWNLQQAMYPVRPGRPRALSGTARVYRAYRPDKSDVTDNAYVRIPVMTLGVKFGEEVTAIFSRGSILVVAGRERMALDEDAAAESPGAVERDPAVHAASMRAAAEHTKQEELRQAARLDKRKGVPPTDSVFDMYAPKPGT